MILTKEALITQLNELFADVSATEITPADFRTLIHNVIQSYEDFVLQLNQADIDALTPANFQIVLNTDLAMYQYYNGAKWVTFQTQTSSTFSKIVVELSSAQILDSNSNPIIAIPNNGDGSAIVVQSAVINYDYGTSAYTSHTSMKVAYKTGGDFCTLSIAGTSDLKTVNAFSGELNVKTGDDIVIYTNGGDPTGGDGTATITIIYYTIEL